MKMRQTDRQCFERAPFINGYAAYYESNRVILLQMFVEDGKNFAERHTNAINAYLRGERAPVGIRNYAW